MSTPFWVSGSAAMKMISSTSSTSISGVTFMSALACGVSPVTTRSAPWCLCACAITGLPRRAPGWILPLGDERDVLDLRLAERVHRVHDRAVLRVLVTLEVDDLFLLVLEARWTRGIEVVGGDRQRVDVELAARVDRDDRLVLRVRLVAGVARLGQRDRHALLQHRRDQHHDDEQHQHDVDERRHVDVRIQAASCPASTHCHSDYSIEIRSSAANLEDRSDSRFRLPHPYAVFLMK